MGIDLVAGGRKVGHNKRTNPVSKDMYLRMLVRTYKLLARRTNSGFNKVVAHRLCLSRTNKKSMGLARIVREMTGKEGIAVIVAPVTDDIRVYEMPAMKVCALRFTEGARKKIVAAGGECMTFDQLALIAPRGENCTMLRGLVTRREAVKHFGGAPGSKHSHVKPYVRKGAEKRRGLI
eukprot:TRINITY_DN198_c0_g1_i1.p1 TRINITY_DN198_c0_g1~~TRINITY_DN198_c0_g1_i1.p1  ORF type:complete len:178 (+),score=35.26 TRINITY_DN198_c0_g1_i1:27-560(+)